MFKISGIFLNGVNLAKIGLSIINRGLIAKLKAYQANLYFNKLLQRLMEETKVCKCKSRCIRYISISRF